MTSCLIPWDMSPLKKGSNLKETICSLRKQILSLRMRQSLLFFFLVVLEKICLAHGLRQLKCDVKSDVRTLNLISDITYATPRKTLNDIRRRSLCGIKCQKSKK